MNFNFASSSTLAEQIQNGAPADVFASADQKNMQKLQTRGAVTGNARPSSPRTRWRSRSSPGNPKHITTVADLAKPGLIVVLCASEAPCGKYADQVLATEQRDAHAEVARARRQGDADEGRDAATPTPRSST